MTSQPQIQHLFWDSQWATQFLLIIRSKLHELMCFWTYPKLCKWFFKCIFSLQYVSIVSGDVLVPTCTWTNNASVHGQLVNSLRLRQNGRHFPDNTFKRIFLNENVRISIKISVIFVPKGPINNCPSLVQMMAWRRPGDKPLSEPMMVRLLMHMCITRPQWVNSLAPGRPTVILS